MLMFEFFYKLAEYANENWGGNLSSKEIAVRAYIYTQDCLASVPNDPFGSIKELMFLLQQDIASGTYASEAEELYSQLLQWLAK